MTNLIKENKQSEVNFEKKLSSELFNFLKFSGSMLLAFPVGLYMRKRIRSNKRLNYILQFEELLQVRNNIEKGSFAYDTILFRQSPWQLFKNKSHLANLVCLAILFGDEFIDGLANEYGKNNIRRILENDQVDSYLQYKKTTEGYSLNYEFDICTLLPAHILETINVKYGISYKAFYGHLQFLLGEMNLHLHTLDEKTASEAAQLICKACNKCFDTYKADINAFDDNYSFADLQYYQKTKDDDIIQVLLTLRAVLLDKKQLHFQKHFTSWSSMVRSMQLYDDMQDVATDCGFQMNVLCYFAREYFIDEWQWLQQNKKDLQGISGLQLHSTISLHMPSSCIMTQQYARNISHTKMSWVQKKIQNYLWRKNWLGFNNRLLNEAGFCLGKVLNKKAISNPFKLYFIQTAVMKASGPFITEEMKLAHIIDIALFDDSLKKYIFKKLSVKEKYFITSCYLEFPLEQKAAIAKRLIS